MGNVVIRERLITFDSSTSDIEGKGHEDPCLGGGGAGAVF